MILGTGASYYVDCTEEPYKQRYQMFTYVTKVWREKRRAGLHVLPRHITIVDLRLAHAPPPPSPPAAREWAGVPVPRGA